MPVEPYSVLGMVAKGKGVSGNIGLNKKDKSRGVADGPTEQNHVGFPPSMNSNHEWGVGESRAIGSKPYQSRNKGRYKKWKLSLDADRMSLSRGVGWRRWWV